MRACTCMCFVGIETILKFYVAVSPGRLLNCGLRATDCIAGCRLRVTDCGLRVAGHTRVAGHRLRAAGCGPHSDCGLRATDCRLLCCGLRATDRGLRATCCELLKLLVAKLQVVKMSCFGLLNCRLWFARLFRLGGCQLLDLLGYNMWVTGYQTSENFSLLAKDWTLKFTAYH